MGIKGLTPGIAAAILVIPTMMAAAAWQAPGPGQPATVPHQARAAGLETTVTGFVWTSADEPVAGATVRLRDLLSGALAALAVTSAAGTFSFHHIEAGTYAVELVDDRDRVVALGQAFSIGPGETVATFVRLQVVRPRLAELFGNAAAAVVSTAAGLGMTAVTPPAQRASPDR